MLYQVVMDEMNGANSGTSLDAIFFLICVFGILIALTFGEKAGKTAMAVGFVGGIAIFLLFVVPLTIISWGVSNGGTFGNIQISLGVLWQVSAIFYLIKFVANIVRDSKKIPIENSPDITK